MALASVGTDWLTEGLLDELFNLGLIAYKSGEDDIKRGGWLLVQACTRVKDRLERLGKLGCNGDERGVIIQVVPRLSEWFQSQPNTKLIRILEDIENGR